MQIMAKYSQMGFPTGFAIQIYSILLIYFLWEISKFYIFYDYFLRFHSIYEINYRGQKYFFLLRITKFIIANVIFEYQKNSRTKTLTVYDNSI